MRARGRLGRAAASHAVGLERRLAPNRAAAAHGHRGRGGAGYLFEAFHGVQDMATAKPAAAKKAAAKPARSPNAAFMKPLTPSPQLAAVVGSAPLPRTEVVKKVWEHIKAAKLQDAANKRMINADDKLRAVFGKSQVTMFEMTKLLNSHLK